MKLYLVTFYRPYDGTETMEIFSTLKEAVDRKNYLSDMKQSKSLIIDTQEMELDKIYINNIEDYDW